LKNPISNTKTTFIKSWLSAFRLRTLPLALSSIGLAAFLAGVEHKFKLNIFLISSLTTILLQILSNLANDYGDSIHGADNESAGRKGPQRAVSSGAISSKAMFNSLILFSILSFISGLSLILISFEHIDIKFISFLIIGLTCIAAAIKYTAGSNPYGYAGLGDLSVLIFFGFVGVLGSYYLYTNSLNLLLILPATTCGLFATAVLNINNIRDIESDFKSGKMSIPVRLGREKAVIYHASLLMIGFISTILYVLITYNSIWNWLFLITLPLIIINLKAVNQKIEPSDLDPYLKQMALTTLLFVLSFGIGQLI
jgi:1,4-dihydroxy-2-naphthoate octaprenyltransferase